MSMLKRIGAYLGLVEEYEEDYELAEEAPARQRNGSTALPATGTEPSNVRRISPPRAPESPVKEAPVRAVPNSSVHLTSPTTFNDVEEVGERFRAGIPVIMNLAGAGENVAKRPLDFASGLIFGLDGRIERVGDRVFLLTPRGVEVSSEERQRLGERGFFNQA
jgi:cell division inhibitor SepF